MKESKKRTIWRIPGSGNSNTKGLFSGKKKDRKSYSLVANVIDFASNIEGWVSLLILAAAYMAGTVYLIFNNFFWGLALVLAVAIPLLAYRLQTRKRK